MQPVFRLHSGPDELQQIREILPPHSKNLFFRQAIKIELEHLYPTTKLELYSYTTDEATYWFAWKINKNTINHAYMCYVGKFNEDQIAEALTMFVEATNPFNVPPLFVGEKIIIDEVEKYVTTHVPEMLGKQNPTNMFYMTEAQMEMVEGLKLPPLPDGYVLGSSNPDTDAELITAMWVHAREGDVEETRSKLSCFPSSCIRYEGKPVAFEMVSQAGQLTALYVLKEHRGKGLGRIVELDLCQKTIRFGMVVIKCVELFNTSLLDSTSRLPYWTKVKQDDGTDLINVYYDMEMK
ncbi:hypothetical protein V3C99_005130 [Haemonchus contortus]